MENIETKNIEDITLEYDAIESKYHNDATVYIPGGVGFHRKSYDSYVRDAKRILNNESKTLNDTGIKRLLAALLIEVFGNENFGDQN